MHNVGNLGTSTLASSQFTHQNMNPSPNTTQSNAMSALTKNTSANSNATKILSPRTNPMNTAAAAHHHSALNAGRNERLGQAVPGGMGMGQTTQQQQQQPQAKGGILPTVQSVPVMPTVASVPSMGSMMPTVSSAQSVPALAKPQQQLQQQQHQQSMPVVTVIPASSASQLPQGPSQNNSVRGGINYSGSQNSSNLNLHMAQRQGTTGSDNMATIQSHGGTAPNAGRTTTARIPIPTSVPTRNIFVPPASEINVFVHVPVHGEMKEIEFAYDSRMDTPESLALEMAQEFGLDKVYQDRICKEIEEQVRKQTGSSTLELYMQAHGMPQSQTQPSLIPGVQQYVGQGYSGHQSPTPFQTQQNAASYQQSSFQRVGSGLGAAQQETDTGSRTPVIMVGNVSDAGAGALAARSVPTPPSDRSSPPSSGIYSRSAYDFPGIIATMQLRKSGGNVPRALPNEGEIVFKSASLKDSKQEASDSSNAHSNHGVPVVVVSGATNQPAQSAVAATGRTTLLSPSSVASGGGAVARGVDPGVRTISVPSTGLAPGAQTGVFSPKNNNASATVVVPVHVIPSQPSQSIPSSKSLTTLKAKAAGGKQDSESPQATSRGRSSTFSGSEAGGSKHNAKLFQACMGLMEAASKGNMKAVKARLLQGAPASYADYDKRTPLHLTATEGHAEIAQLLISHGADFEAVDRWGSTPMKDALKNNHMDVVDVLEEAGAEREVTDEEIMSYELLEFSARGLVDLVRERLVAGISADTADYDKRTPLHLAASEGHPDVAELLLLNGAKISAKDRYGRTPVDDAINNGHRSVLMVLQRFGAAIPLAASEMANSEQTSLGMDLVENAAKGRLDVVRRLISAGAPVDWADYDKRSALHLAVAEGHVEIVRALLDAGAQFDIKDRWDKTPFDDARALEDLEISKQILDLLTQKQIENAGSQPVTDPASQTNGTTDVVSAVTSIDTEETDPIGVILDPLATSDTLQPDAVDDALDSVNELSLDVENRDSTSFESFAPTM
eukprot:CAMPEP_0184698266 /NCGR_PEP_ID=MMETSP0313-20130426/4949_1 /TAXON_ID=2792 /ORGANISM="Porphyridium aerugineum, Strain SAG 1380-2" /LENGTH=1010 /DNA_ID=CAMNT_0027157183 /DNA_START=15 /DNA_END=3047 /DNA_ORIENTATION=+